MIPKLHPGFLPLTVEYALRAMVCLAAAPKGEWVTRDSVMQNAFLPEAYASKILRWLVEGGLIEAKKGWYGGFRLAKTPESILFLDILRVFEDADHLKHCAFGYPVCDDERPCPLHDARKNLLAHIRQWAATYTLADVGHEGFRSVEGRTPPDP